MTEGEKLAYLAGLVDGEGTITITKQKNNKRKRTMGYRVRLTVGSTDRLVLEWCKENFGGTIQTSMNGGMHHKQLYQWVLGMEKAVWLLRKMKQYLIIKPAQAELVLDFYEKCKKGKSKTRSFVPLLLYHKQESYFQQIKAMHH